MSTALSYPDATSPTPPTGILWLTEGTGSSRDKKVQAGTLVRDLLGSAILGQAAPTGVLDGTETFPIVQGGACKEISLLDAVGAAATGAPSGTVLDTTRVLVDQSELAALPITDFLFRGVDLSKATTTPPVWDSVLTGHTNADWGTVCGAGWISVVRTPSLFHGPRFDIEVYATFKDIAGSSTNSDSVVLKVPIALFPTGWWTEISEILALARSGQVWPIKMDALCEDNQTYPSLSRHLVRAKQVSTDLYFDFGMAWSTLMPQNSVSGAHIQCRCPLLPYDLAASL